MRLTILAVAALALVGAGRPPSVEQQVIAELSWVRAHPRAYADELRHYRDSFDGRIAHPDDAPDGLTTHEGVVAVDEAIAFLDRQAPLPPFGEAAILARGAGQLVAEQSASGGLGHYSAGGLNPGDRVRRAGGDIYVGEVITYGPRDARGVVRQLIVDDGVARRGHRLQIFSTQYRFAGAACGPHARYGTMCVVDLSATPDGRPKLPAGGGN